MSQGTSEIVVCAAIFSSTVALTLKLVGVAPVALWSWWLVTAPLWGTVEVLLVLALFGLIRATTSGDHDE